MFILLIRAVLLYFLTLLAMKAMGKRELGQLQPFELVVILIISDMASLAMQNTGVTLANSLIPIATITILQISLSVLNLKSEKCRAFFCGRPVLLIKNGVISEPNMVKLRLNLNDLEEMCRSQGHFDISGIENAVMETNGQLSIMPKTAKRPLQLGDVEPSPPQEQMSALLILDGHANQRALKALGYDEQWLQNRLRPLGLKRFEEVFVAGIDENGEIFAQKKNHRQKEAQQ
jgi:uncharacterized membrane protein YcaP (DUF421 family)